MKKVLLSVLILALLCIVGFAVTIQAQTFEKSIKNRICSETNLDPDLVGVILYDKAGTRLMLTFIYINERTLESNLKQSIKDAIRPYQNQEAVLVLATARGKSQFDPHSISFSQHGFEYEVEPGEIVKITSDFKTGILEGTTSEGIVLLKEIDTSKKFQVGYKSKRHIVSLAPTGSPQVKRELLPKSERKTKGSNPINNLVGGMFKYGLANLVWAFFLSFLVI